MLKEFPDVHSNVRAKTWCEPRPIDDRCSMRGDYVERGSLFL